MPENPQHRRRLSKRPEKPPPPPAPLPYSSSSKNAPRGGKNVEHDLFTNLVDMVPLVESLMDRRANPSFRRRASIVQTATPKVLDPKGKRPGQATSAIQQRDRREAISNGHAQKKDGNADCTSPFSSRASREEEQEDAQKENEELTMLREQLDALHNILAEREEALKSAEESVDQMRTTYATFDELKRKNLERDSLLASTNSQLSNAKVANLNEESMSVKQKHMVFLSILA